MKYLDPVAPLVESEGRQKNTEDKPDAPNYQLKEIPYRNIILICCGDQIKEQ
jgi:hypothetical protein